MSLLTHVPADVDAISLSDLVADCREVSGMLGIPASYATLPRQAAPAHDELVIDLDAVAVLDGWSSYGS